MIARAGPNALKESTCFRRTVSQLPKNRATSWRMAHTQPIHKPSSTDDIYEN
jgi:hypothetical protein